MDTLVTALVNAATQAVTIGKITQTQVDKILSALKTRITDEVNDTRPIHRPSPTTKSTPKTTKSIAKTAAKTRKTGSCQAP